MERRSWGYYQVLFCNSICKVKILYVEIENELSYQYHAKRDEHWIIIQGNAKSILDDETIYLAKGDSLYICKLQKHTVKNVGQEQLIICEVQTGESFDEEDIVRLRKI